MIVCVTGASGFVGSHLIPVLRKQHHSVRVLIRDGAQKISGVDYFVGPVNNQRILKKFIRGADIVVNLIGTFTPPFEKQMCANAEVPYRIFAETGKLGVRRILHISAAAVYGDLAIRKKPKETDLTLPSTTYGLSKIIGEQLVLYLANLYSLHAVILRPTNIYGEDAKAGVIHAMYEAYRHNKTIQVTGDGRQVRDFIHVDDLISAIVLLIEDQKAHGIYNIASDDTYSIGELARLFSKTSPSPVSVIPTPAAPGFVQSLRADTKKMFLKYSWRPNHTVSDTITTLITK